jgi:alkylation response protein AidB-like acyl-CoA dehydrogenase
MDFSFTEDQNSIRDLVKQVLTDIVTDDSLKALDKEGTWFHERAWKQLAESEMLGLAIPEEYGGAGMGRSHRFPRSRRSYRRHFRWRSSGRRNKRTDSSAASRRAAPS